LGPIIFGRGEEELPDAVARMLVERGESVALAESCTGGLLGKLLTDRPGSSAYFRGGVIAYSNESKQHLVGVPPDVLETAGAVSAATAEALVDNVRQRFGSTYGISVTGIAGPGGGTPDKPVGLVYIGLATPDGVLSFEQRFGDMPRDVIRHRSAHHAFHKLWVAMTNSATLRQ
jgi:nicotinamide-nucleotide amidase